MDSFELNKVAGAVLGTLLLAVGSGFVAELIYHPKPAGNAGYALPEPTPASGGGGTEAAKVEPIAVRLATASAEKGQAGSKACVSCHSFEKGGANKVGPGLWEVVERPVAQHGGFDYSASLKEKGGTWSYDALDGFLANPKGYAKGTKMAYAGISSPQERANVVAYLRTLSDSPKPLPAAEKKAEEAKPAEGKPADAKPAAEARPAPDAKPAEGQPAEGQPAAAKPAETAPAQTKPAEPKPAEAKPAEAKPADEKAEAGKPPAETAPGEGTTTRNEPSTSQAPEATTGQTKPVEAAPAAPAAPAATKPANEADPAAVQKAEEGRIGKDKPAQDTPAGEKPAQQ